MITFSKTSEKCKACKHYDDCDNKRMVMCAMAEFPSPVLATDGQSDAAPLMQDMDVKHDCGTAHAVDGMNFDIDLEEAKRQIERDLYKAFDCPFLNYGA